jgi:CHAD domain-containing protein
MGVSPAIVAGTEIDTLLSHIDGVRDGNPEDVHQGRVTTRRLRELLPLVAVETASALDTAAELLRDTGRALGTVRELDTLVDLCGRVADENPPAAAVLAVCRSRLRAERQAATRKLIKRLEDVDVQRLRRLMPRRSGTLLRWTARSPGWRSTLRERIDKRASTLTHAVEHAGGVYMPNRLHAVRIALKKLRYAVEIADQTGLWQPRRLLRDARRLQERLGTIHDMEILVRRLNEIERNDPLHDQVVAVSSIVRGTILAEHERDCARRDRLLLIARACHAQTHHGSRRWHVPGARIAAAMVLPIGMAWIGHRDSTRLRGPSDAAAATHDRGVGSLLDQVHRQGVTAAGRIAERPGAI